jgi:hypothetical protein
VQKILSSSNLFSAIATIPIYGIMKSQLFHSNQFCRSVS